MNSNESNGKDYRSTTDEALTLNSSFALTITMILIGRRITGHCRALIKRHWI